MQNTKNISASPFLRDNDTTTRGIMLDVILAMVPTILASVWFFGYRALLVITVAVVVSVFSEWLYQYLTKQKSTIGDLSAVVTAILFAFNLPSDAPIWMVCVGSVLAIILIKQFFGGIGQNFMNPALGARTILMLSWASLMSATVMPNAGEIIGMGAVDIVSQATPLATNAPVYSIMDLFLGNIPGMLGETQKLTLIIGGLWLIWRKVIDWRVPITFLGTCAVLFWIQTGTLYSVESGANNVLYQLLSGGLILGAFFMATDYVTCPIQKTGRIIMGVGCGFFVFIIRAYSGSYPEGTSFAILFMNLLTPLIDKLTLQKSFGSTKKKGGLKA